MGIIRRNYGPIIPPRCAGPELQASGGFQTPHFATMSLGVRVVLPTSAQLVDGLIRHFHFEPSVDQDQDHVILVNVFHTAALPVLID